MALHARIIKLLMFITVEVIHTIMAHPAVDSENPYEYQEWGHAFKRLRESGLVGCPKCDSDVLLVRESDEKCPECDYRDVYGKCNQCLASLTEIGQIASPDWRNFPDVIYYGCPDCEYLVRDEQTYAARL